MKDLFDTHRSGRMDSELYASKVGKLGLQNKKCLIHRLEEVGTMRR